MMARGGEQGLDAGHRFVYAAVRAVAQGRPLPVPDPTSSWQRRATEQQVLTVLAAHLAQDPELAYVRRLRAAQQLVVDADLRRIHDVFERRGIEWLLFKGPVLSDVVYQRPGARAYSDLDVLVRPEDVERAVAALESIDTCALDGGWQAMQAIGDGESTYGTPSGIMVDLHWDVINDARIRPAFAVATEDLFRRARPVAVGDLTLRTFDAVDTLLHVALHASTSGGDRLRWLLDVHQCLLRCGGMADEIGARATEMGLGLVLRVMCARVRRFVDDAVVCPLPGSPSIAERLWLAADAAMTHRHPPGARHEGRPSGALVPMSTRADGRDSWTALLAAVPGRAIGRASTRVRSTARSSGLSTVSVTPGAARSTSER